MYLPEDFTVDELNAVMELNESLANRPGRYYDRDGREISVGVWHVLLGRGEDYRRVGLHTENGHTVSTVWVGLAIGSLLGESSESTTGVYETLVTDDSEKSSADGKVYRHYCYEEARSAFLSLTGGVGSVNSREGGGEIKKPEP